MKTYLHTQHTAHTHAHKTHTGNPVFSNEIGKLHVC